MAMLQILIPVIVGGLIAVIGGLVGPPFLHRMQVKADTRKRRAEKFEELVGALYEHNHWLDMHKNIKLFANEGVLPVSPMGKVQAIISVYFPQFRTQINE